MKTTTLLIVATAIASALAGCSREDEGPRGVLTVDDVGNVRATVDGVSRGLGVSFCPGLGVAELRLSRDNGANDNVRRFTLDGGDVVGSSADGVSSAYDSASEALDVLDATLSACPVVTNNPYVTFETLRLSGDAIGYRETLQNTQRRRVLTRVFAPHGDHVVQVSVLHTGKGDPSVDARTLLRTALERADELD